MFRFVVFAASALVLLAADNPPNVKVVEEIAAKVNGDIITRGDLERKRMEIEVEARRQGLKGDQLTRTVNDYAKELLMKEIDELLLVQKAKDLNINVDTEVNRR